MVLNLFLHETPFLDSPFVGMAPWVLAHVATAFLLFGKWFFACTGCFAGVCAFLVAHPCFYQASFVMAPYGG